MTRTHSEIVHEILVRLYGRGYIMFGKDARIEELFKELEEAEE